MARLCKCGDPIPRKWERTCRPCGEARYMFSNYVSGRAAAASAVARARRRGELAPVSDFRCADCGIQATAYDHRDYNFPLRVEPVCHGCNCRRGPAIPKNWTLAEFWEWRRSSAQNKYVKDSHVLSSLRADVVERAFRLFRPDDWHRIWPELVAAEAG